MEKQSLLVDTEILIYLHRLKLFSAFLPLKSNLKCRFLITSTIYHEELKDVGLKRAVDRLLATKVLTIFQADPEKDKDIVKEMEQLNKYMHTGEASLFAVALHKGLSIVTHDLDAVRVFQAHYPDSHVFCYDLYVFMFLLHEFAHNTVRECEEYLKCLKDDYGFIVDRAINYLGLKGFFEKIRSNAEYYLDRHVCTLLRSEGS
jgi:rRNA-processing protein FCF1